MKRYNKKKVSVVDIGKTVIMAVLFLAGVALLGGNY